MGDKERGILLVYNNTSGSGKSIEPASQAAKFLLDKRYPFDLQRFSEVIDNPGLLEESAAVCVYGGDGTIYSIARMIGKSDRKPALVPMPTGTENVLAKTIHGNKFNLESIPWRVMDTLNGGENPLNRINLTAGTYTAGDSPPEHMYWLLTAGDSGITRRTLAALNRHQEQPKPIKNAVALYSAFTRPDIPDPVLVTIYDKDGERVDEFDALEVSTVKQIPGKWSRVNVVPHDDLRDQVFSIGRGQTDYRSRMFAYRTLTESLKAMLGREVDVYDEENRNNPILTRRPLNTGETVVFTAANNGIFTGLVADSEIHNGTSFNRIRIKPTVSDPIVEIFSARQYPRR